ncbi:unnamed protein product [Phytophthora fragariaefolia]|uniref:Unnamed protein product n=1 Tax=Phytophthora fragariaefolia TaxID=1490495 RepID=A0A9W6WVY2_9STRA|nr:unnamed protein product [Phytophthora fragariaefolia]
MDVQTQAIVYSRDVVFHENHFPTLENVDDTPDPLPLPAHLVGTAPSGNSPTSNIQTSKSPRVGPNSPPKVGPNVPPLITPAAMPTPLNDAGELIYSFVTETPSTSPKPPAKRPRYEEAVNLTELTSEEDIQEHNEHYEVHRMYVKTAFLNGILSEEIYMAQPEGFAAAGQEHLVCKLLKSLYGLKQAPRIWYKTLCAFIESLGFHKLIKDSCVFMATFDDQVCYIAVYVDDPLIIAPTISLVCRINSALKQRFSMADLGEVKYILGWSIERDREARTIFIHQQKYATNVLDKFKHLISYPTATPLDRNIKLTKAMEPQTQEEREAIKDIPCGELAGTSDQGLLLGGSTSVNARTLADNLTAYTDSDYANCPVTRRSVGGYATMIGASPITWLSRKHHTVVLALDHRG